MYGIRTATGGWTTYRFANEAIKAAALQADRTNNRVRIMCQPSGTVSGVPKAPHRYADVHPNGFVAR